MGTVVFSYSDWSTRYPSLASSVSSDLANLYFAEATLYLDNTDCSIVSDVSQRAILLNMLVAHIAVLNIALTDPSQAKLVGHIVSAAQGTVNVSLAPLSGNLPDWYAQTAYGLSFWQATARYRTMRYVPAPQTVDQRWQRRL